MAIPIAEFKAKMYAYSEHPQKSRMRGRSTPLHHARESKRAAGADVGSERSRRRQRSSPPTLPMRCSSAQQVRRWPQRRMPAGATGPAAAVHHVIHRPDGRPLTAVPLALRSENIHRTVNGSGLVCPNCAAIRDASDPVPGTEFLRPETALPNRPDPAVRDRTPLIARHKRP
jgi:hypothetical protein